MKEVVATVRRFNRSYTQRIGVLDDSFLGSGRALGPARLLFEIGPTGASVLELRGRLGLDSGYLSRMLRQLELDGVVTVSSDPMDARRRVGTLTTQGLAEWSDLDRRSDALAGRLVAPLSDRQREQLRESLATADHLLRLATISFDAVDPRSTDAIWALRQYFAELDQRFSTGFDSDDALSNDPAAMRSPLGLFVVARSDDDSVACGGAQRVDETTCEIKRMWVHAEWRGVGLGKRLLGHLESCGRDLGYERVVLDTNSVLTEAIAMYQRSGYRSIERYNDNPYAMCWFEKRIG
ncbi:MAG: bifunctional helix-turn-helix transcriptional regulator/GNAT family N-acetyltransferase [Ilumatobacteraceae bacterium]